MYFMARVTDRSKRLHLSLPSVVFALAFILLGWIASHSIAYTLVGLASHGHGDHHEQQHIHGYMQALELAAGGVLVLAFGLALRAFFRYGSFGEWLHEGGIAGVRKQLFMAAVLPAGVFVVVEHLERLAAGTGTAPSAQLLAVGVFVQVVVGLLCLVLVRLTFRVAERVIVSIARRPFVRPDRRTTAPVFESLVFARSLCPMAGSRAGRAPPTSAAFF